MKTPIFLIAMMAAPAFAGNFERNPYADPPVVVPMKRVLECPLIPNFAEKARTTRKYLLDEGFCDGDFEDDNDEPPVVVDEPKDPKKKKRKYKKRKKDDKGRKDRKGKKRDTKKHDKKKDKSKRDRRDKDKSRKSGRKGKRG